MDTGSSITDLLNAWAAGDRHAFDELMRVVYSELRAKAGQLMAREGPHLLDPTALVHEVYIGLERLRSVSWEGRGKFFAYVGLQMRHILVEYARAAQAQKRGGNAERVALTESLLWADAPAVDLLDLDVALNELEVVDPELVRLVELRFFAGLTEEETAEALGRSKSSVYRDWNIAKRFLADRLRPMKEC